MRGRGRPRKRTACPPHIDQGKLPDYCYWDPSGKGHWYTVYKDGDKPRRRKIADPDATLSDLHKAMEEGSGVFRNTFGWLAEEFEKSPQFQQKISADTRRSYVYCKKVVCDYPTLKPGVTLKSTPRTDWSPPLVQKLIDGVGQSRGASSAKHVHGYIRRLWNWGRNRGYCGDNPCRGIELPKERKRRRLPERALVSRLVAFAQERGARPSRSKGSCPYYIWIALEFAFSCRLRGVEVFRMHDGQTLEHGILCLRAKGSGSNVTRWSPRLKAAHKAAQDARTAIWGKKGRPIPLDPAKRPMLVNTAGNPVKQGTWQNSWSRFLALAIKEGVIEPEDAFGLHDMKRRGTTDTKGTKMEKLDATGHSSLAMLDIYDLSVPEVDAAE